jgi:2,3-bisphosphoglycerate-independent phosphoglycerate mutase
MDSIELMKSLSVSTPSKIVLIVIDGLGGLPDPVTHKTELETAKKPNLDKLAANGILGLSDPVAPGITPGSGAGHLGLFGYDPLAYNIGRGALEAVGIDFDLRDGDIATRGNFCSIDSTGKLTDRRAGRIPTDKCVELCKILDGMTIDGVKVFVQPVKDYRFVAVFRGEGLGPDVTDSDPQREGLLPLEMKAVSPGSKRMAEIANKFAAKAKELLSGHHPANMLLLRGFSVRPHFPTMADIYKLKAGAVAAYPMYRGLARLVGMDVQKTGPTIAEEFETLKQVYDRFDFVFLHIKPADAAGEDGDFARKVSVIEEVDRSIPVLAALRPDVIVVTGDHSTPAMLKSHSWHPVPLLIHARYCRPDAVTSFGESACLSGGLGRIQAVNIMPLAMANALKLNKFGA